MSGGRIIRSQYYGAEPVVIGGQNRGGKSSHVDTSHLPYYSEEDYLTRLNELEEKERSIEERIKEAEEQAEVILKSAEDEKKGMIQGGAEVAQKMIDETEEKIQARLKEIETDIKHDREQARKEGHDEGFKKGEEEGRQHGEEVAREQIQRELAETIKKANAQAQHTLETARAAADDYVKQAEQDIVRVVLTAIEKILPQHFLDVPQVILPFVQNAIQKVRDQKEVIVHVPTEAYDLVLMAQDEFRAMLTDGTAHLEIKSDDSLKPGDCVIETPNGGVDARLQTQIEIVKQAILNMLPKENQYIGSLPIDLSTPPTTVHEQVEEPKSESPPEEEDPEVKKLYENLDKIDFDNLDLNVDVDETGMTQE
ncbi:MAG: flagellar assembly protein FliH [Selenomonadaceae bacterium]|nr:flagellar assembly protein FliH [Selenomonadaceae bacterium]